MAYKGYPSRRAYENVRAQEAGFENYAQWQKLRSNQLYMRWVRIKAGENAAHSPEAPPTLRRRYRGLSTAEGIEFNRLVSRIINTGEWDEETGRVKGGATPNLARLFRYLKLQPEKQSDWNRLFQISGDIRRVVR